MRAVTTRLLDRRDGPFLRLMLREADRWRLPVDAPRPPLAEVLADPHVALYVRGYVAPDVPEISLAVAPSWRRRGIGLRLLSEATARSRALGHAGVSLSVMPDNPARRLYERLGFRRLATVDSSWTMLLRLADEPQTPAAGMHQPLGT
ncbi:MAG: GNAT family N-acetyltransferase [Actinobacteria bacterium]|nr:GNAT family N-acetyltransferase [Actinomycetota bacterium]